MTMPYGDLALVVLPLSFALNIGAFAVVLREIKELRHMVSGDADTPGVLTRLALLEQWQKSHAEPPAPR